MLTTDVKGMRRGLPVGGMPGSLVSERMRLGQTHKYKKYLQPVDLFVVSEAEDELVHDPIGANRAADQLQRCIIRIAVDEVVKVEVAQTRSSNASGQLVLVSDSSLLDYRQGSYSRDVVHVWLLHHRRHGLID